MVKKSVIQNCFNSLFVARRRSYAGEQGFSLIELLIAMVIIVIALVPIMDSITSSFHSTHVAEENTIIVNLAREKMEDVIAMNFIDVIVSAPSGTPTALSDIVTVLGKNVKRSVLVELYDGDGDAIPDIDLKIITVIIEGIEIQTLMADF